MATIDREVRAEDENTVCRAERITAWEREIAMCECDSSKILDDEIKVGTVLLRLPESQLKTLLPMRANKLTSGQTSERKWLRFLVRLPLLSHSRHRWTLVQWARRNQMLRDRKELANVTIRLSKHVSGAETRIPLLHTVLTGGQLGELRDAVARPGVRRRWRAPCVPAWPTPSQRSTKRRHRRLW